MRRDDPGPGGLLMYGIPNMKLEKEIIDRKVRVMEQEGVVFETGVDVGKNPRAQKLLKEFDCVLFGLRGRPAQGHQGPGKGGPGHLFCGGLFKGDDQKPSGFGV